MAKFKVGDRVRVRKTAACQDVGAAIVRGHEGVIVAASAEWGPDWWVVDAPSAPHDTGPFRYAPTIYHIAGDALEPLTPPASDTWAADKVKQVTKPQHIEPVAPKLPTHV